MVRALFSVAVTLAMALAVTFYTALASAMELPETIDNVRPGIVSIGIVRPAKQVGKHRPSMEYRGTGFVVGNGRQVMTNFHVLPDEEAMAPNGRLVAFVGRGKTAEPRSATVVRVDKTHDLALLTLSGKPLPALSLSSSKTVREGQELAFTGFPIGMVLGMYPSTNKGIVSAITPVAIPAVSSGNLTAAQVRRIRDPYFVYQLDAIAYPGNSGSPVYEVDTGKVVGVINSVFIKESKEGALSKPSGITYAIPVKYVKELLSGE